MKISATKDRMSQIFRKDGTVVPVSWCTVEQLSKLKVGDKVGVRGTSKGKGFQGVVKRWGFKGAASKTHGTKHTERAPGSIGSAFPQKVFKGKKMAGQMGAKSITVKNLEVVKVETKTGKVAIKGAIPGFPGSSVVLEL